MSKDKLNVRVYHIEQGNALKSAVKEREVVLFERYGVDTARALSQLISSEATSVNFLRPKKLGWRARRAEAGLVAYTNDLGKPEGFLKARLLDPITYEQVSVLFDMLPSYQAVPAYDMTPPGGIAVIVCRMPYSSSREERTPETQRVIDSTIAVWEALNDHKPKEEQRGLVLLFL